MIRPAHRHRGAQPLGAMPKWVQSALSTAATSTGLTVVMDTNVTGPSILYQAGKPPEKTSRGAHLVGMLLQPTVYVRSSVANETVAPYGVAQRNLGPALGIGAGVVGLLATYGLWALATGK